MKESNNQMNDAEWDQRLSSYITPLPVDFHEIVTKLCTANGIPQFADPIIYNLECARSIGQHQGKELHAGHIAGITLSTIFMMINKKFDTQNIASAIKVGPAIITAIISDEKARYEALGFYFERIDELEKQ
jgi:hypothetical protein